MAIEETRSNATVEENGYAGDKPSPPEPMKPTPRRATMQANTRAAVPATGAGGGCGCAGGDLGPATYVYAIGTISARMPSLGVEKQFAQASAQMSREGKTKSATDPQLVYEVLKANRYLANELCYVLSIEGIDTYLLAPRDPFALDQLIEAIKPSTVGLDVDVVVGTKGPTAPAEACNGLEVPVVIFDRIWSFDRAEFTKAIPRPKDAKDEDKFRALADEMFLRVGKLSDNAGATDEHRAVNYLAVSYPAVYAKVGEMYGRDGYLSALDVQTSRLSQTRKIMDVILAFTNRATDVIEKFHVRVDVTEKYPFLVTKLEPYYDIMR